ncbi:hypothetical protein [Bacillus sp. JJ722]|uniref:hypothetical protein n=1 Tax=Bacillus sp. JJ722 TaxID=3122973 RepID=UPI002FFECAC2
MQKIKWNDGNTLMIEGNCCFNIKKDTKLLFPEGKICGEVWLESLDLQEMIKHAKSMEEKDYTIPIVCNSIWLEQNRMNLFLQNRDLFEKVVVLPYERGQALDEKTYWRCFQRIMECINDVPKEMLVIDLVMGTTISSETKTIESYVSILKTLNQEGYQTLISLDNYKFHSKDQRKDENLLALYETLKEKDLTYLLSLNN